MLLLNRCLYIIAHQLANKSTKVHTVYEDVSNFGRNQSIGFSQNYNVFVIADQK